MAAFMMRVRSLVRHPLVADWCWGKEEHVLPLTRDRHPQLGRAPRAARDTAGACHSRRRDLDLSLSLPKGDRATEQRGQQPLTFPNRVLKASDPVQQLHVLIQGLLQNKGRTVHSRRLANTETETDAS